MNAVIDQFRDAMRARYIIPPAEIQAEGLLHRCDVEGGKRGKGDGAYLLHLDGIPAGGFENWRDGLGWQNWRAEPGRRFTDAERAVWREKQAKIARERDTDRARRHAEAAARAADIWQRARPGPHAYLAHKGIEAHGARVYKGALTIPARDAAGTLHSLQFIADDGGKRFLTGGRIEGCHFGMGGKPADVLCIAEGFATGASVFKATGYPVAVAFNAGNLEAVALALRRKLPAGVRLIICGDDDRETESRTGRNPGRIKAQAAARAVRGLVALPSFAEVAA